MKLLFFVLFLTLAALVGCDSPDAPDFFKSKGDEVTHEWRFDSLITVYNFNDAFDVSLVKDTVDYAVITCGKNLLVPCVHVSSSCRRSCRSCLRDMH